MNARKIIEIEVKQEICFCTNNKILHTQFVCLCAHQRLQPYLNRIPSHHSHIINVEYTFSMLRKFKLKNIEKCVYADI